MTAPEVIRMIRPVEMKSPGALAFKRLGRAAEGMGEAGIGPADLHQEIVGAAERGQAAFHGLLPVLDAGRRPKALRRDGADGGQRVLDAMMQFAQDQLLQLVGGLALLGVDAGLRQQCLGVDAGLFEQHPKAVVLRRQYGLVRGERRAGLTGAAVGTSGPPAFGASGTIFSAPAPTIACNSADHLLHPSGLPKKRLSAGRSASDGFTWPETRMILMPASGHAPCGPA